jgi:hypothetical protein
MEAILSIVVIYGIIFGIGAFFSWLGKLNDKRKENIRNKVLDNFKKEFDISKEINKYKEKLEQIDYQKQPTATENYLKNYIEERNVKMIGEFGKFLGKCPSCENGKLVGRKGQYGSFIGCSNYPKCKYTENVKSAKKEYKEEVEKKIIQDIEKAYS